ncbi:MAG: DUF1700 domain-containing protein [Ruminococcus sp.]|nr:DUF1700 domain-containing protein [Ruminococcus sp.]
MNQCEFICELNRRLSGLPEEDINKSIDYYCELIDDYIEDGKSEEEAVAALGDIDDIVNQIYTDTPLSKIVKAKVKPNRALRAWEIILIVLGSPIWLSIMIAVLAVVFSVYIVLWSVVISLYSVVLSVAVTSLVLFIGILVSVLKGLFLNAVIFLALTLVLAGLTILLFVGTNYFAKAMIIVSKLIFKSIKQLFIGRGAK